MLTIDYANCLSDRVGNHGLDAAELHATGDAAASIAVLTRKLTKTRGTGWERWRELPHGAMRKEHLDGVSKAVERCKGKFENMVVLGIGGSALGNIALQAALNPATYNLDSTARKGPRMFVVDNVDPANFGAVLRFCEHNGGIKKTLFNVVSKSGETATRPTSSPSLIRSRAP
jgi:glucose-6-phosphate isomerase